MTQYCRYCNNMVCGDANYCTVHNECYSEEQICRPNKCKEFEFNRIDALWKNLKGYRPRKAKEKIESAQMPIIESENDSNAR